jgi:dTDP-4-amino-4,6-dideoxygalactose transaminase
MPDFADIDPVTCNLCPQKLEQIWTADVKAVVPVHYGGAPADMDAISQLARRHGAMIIEDACHAIGGSILVDGQPVKIGATPYADMTTFSLHPVKTITSGEGGLIVTQNSQLAARLRQLRTHGMTRQIESTVGLGLPSYDERGPWYYEMQQLGYNYRITDFQCALGISQLARLDDYVRRRREIVARYNAAFADHPYFILPTVSRAQEQPHTSWHLYTLRIDFESLSKTRTEVMNMLREQGIGTQVLYIPVYLQPWYRQTYGYQAGKCPQAELFYRQALSLPLYPTMTDGDVDYVIQNMLQSCEC